MKQRENISRQALAINPDDTISSHLMHALSGATDANTTPEYAQNLFNNYALYYDQHMQGQLNYSIPKHIGRILHQLELTQVLRSLDLGCGTGLTGVVLREISKHVTGVDIAEKMIAHAKEKGIYDTLVQSELIEFFQQNKQSYGLIVAADVLPYFGDLAALFAAISEHLLPDGYFIFTTEISKTTPWFLELSARFSHHPDYIINLIEGMHCQLVKQRKNTSPFAKPAAFRGYVVCG